MKLKEIFDSIKPVLDSFITEKHELEKRISQDGTLPDEVITECPIHDIVKVEKFDEKTIESTKNFVKWVQENKITRIEGNTKNIYFRSSLQKIEGKKGNQTVDSMILSRHQGLQKNEIKEYEFKFALSDLKKKDFYKILKSYSFSSLITCEHLNPDTITDAKPVILSTKNFHSSYSSYIGEGSRTLADALKTSSTDSNLQLFCIDCYRRIDHLCCKNAIDRRGISYEASYRHPLDTILLKLNLKKQNLSFSEISASERFGRESLQFFLTDYKALLTEESRDLDQTIEALKPEIVIARGKKQSMIDYLKHDVSLIIFDDSKDAKQRFFLFDKDKKVEKNIEKCCLHIIRNLETYSEKIRAKEHDKLIGALEKIGHELGYVPQREVVNKGSRVDLVWLDRNGAIFSALEVETSSGWKKDVVTTWEIEPKLAVILAHQKTEKGIKDIIQYTLLKGMPHKLLFINNISKKAYLVEKQNILKYYDIEKKEEIEPKVFEF